MRGRARLAIASLALALGLTLWAQAIASAQGGPATPASTPRVATPGPSTFIGTDPGEPIAPPAAAAGRSDAAVARAFLNARSHRFDLDDPGAGLDLLGSSESLPGLSSVRFAQTIDGLPVIGGEVVVSLDSAQNILAAAGETLASKGAPPSDPAISAAAAKSIALESIAKGSSLAPGELSASEPELSYYHPSLLGGPGIELTSLVWNFEVTAGPVDGIRQRVLVDADNGDVVLSFNQIAHALDRRVCDANNFPAQVPCTAPVRTEGQGPHPVPDVNFAYDFSGDTYNFFMSRFGRDSLDGAGMPLISTVRFCETLLPGECPYENAFWNGQQMVYGQGFAAADDVVAHELAHGVTEFSSNLYYYYQSGAINESMSDVFGEFVDLTNNPDDPADRWLLGEDVPGGGAIRDMENPPAFNDPDRMNSPLYVRDVDQSDNGGVHSNSGVNNKATVLMTDGTGGTGPFNGQSVAGLGIDKVAQIYYVANNSLLTSGSDYLDLYNALNQACTASVGVFGITTNDCAQANNALLAVEMNQVPANAPAREAPVCPGDATRTDVFSDNMEATANWTTNSADWAAAQFYATSGKGHLYGDNPATVADISVQMAQSVTIPTGAPAFLRFNHAHGFEDDDSDNPADPPGRTYDGGVVEYSVDGGTTWIDAGPLFTDASGYNGTIGAPSLGVAPNPLDGRAGFVAESFGYISSRLDLSSLAGQNVAFRFRIGSDGTLGDEGWYIDDFAIYTCGDVDADDDGIPDASDACPAVTGGATPDGCPRIKRRVALSYSNARNLFRGSVRPRGGCARRVVVRIFQADRGPDTFIGRRSTSRNGTFKLRDDADIGRYYAKVSRQLVPTGGLCLPARSPVVKVNR